MPTIKQAQTPPENRKDMMNVSSGAAMNRPAAPAAQSERTGLNQLAIGPVPSILGTVYDTVRQWIRPGTPQFRTFPLPVKNNQQVTSIVKSVIETSVSTSGGAPGTTPSGTFLPLAGGTLSGALVFAPTAAPFAINSQTASPSQFGGNISTSGNLFVSGTATFGAVGTAGQVLLKGSTSGTAAITAPGVAGTITNPITVSNSLQLATGTVLNFNGDTGISRDSAGAIDIGNGTAGDKSGTINLAILSATSPAATAAITLHPPDASTQVEIGGRDVANATWLWQIQNGGAAFFPHVESTNGYTIGGAAPTGHVLRGNSVYYVDAVLAAADLSNGTTGSGAVVEAVAPTVTTPKWTAYTVAGLPAGSEGQYAYASNGRKVGEGGGAGTGVPVYFSNALWRVFSTDAAVAA